MCNICLCKILLLLIIYSTKYIIFTDIIKIILCKNCIGYCYYGCSMISLKLGGPWVQISHRKGGKKLLYHWGGKPPLLDCLAHLHFLKEVYFLCGVTFSGELIFLDGVIFLGGVTFPGGVIFLGSHFFRQLHF